MEYASLAEDPHAAVRAALAGHARGVAVLTTGSTGAPRTVLLSSAALRASAEASHRRLSGPGRWLSTLPLDRIAGAQVLLRSALAGTEPLELAPGPFTATAFADAAQRLADETAAGIPLYTSLVPTQVHRLMRDDRGRASLGLFTAVLMGGASAAGLELPPHVVETYGMTETAGGCVYDGMPLDEVEAAVGGDGRIHIAGPVLADGYADGDNSGFVRMAGRRWLKTADLGAEQDGLLRVWGRVDDIIVTGGQKVHPAMVEAALSELPGVAEVAVSGVADAEWGQRVTALVVPVPGMAAPTLEQARAALAQHLPAAALPRAVSVVDALPLLAPGKIDRRRAGRLASGGGAV